MKRAPASSEGGGMAAGVVRFFWFSLGLHGFCGGFEEFSNKFVKGNYFFILIAGASTLGCVRQDNAA